VIATKKMSAKKIQEAFDFLRALEEAFAEVEALPGQNQLEELKETLRRVVIQKLLREARRVLGEGEK
jgi:NifB/MoaA-like Fe-S oxidoreductase